MEIINYKIHREPSKTVHPWLAEQEAKVLRGEAVAGACLKLRSEGFSPHVICAHPGWGEALFLKDVWPEAKMICFCEFYYRPAGSDIGFDPEFSISPGDADLYKLRMKNAHNLISLDAADRGVAPTLWQRDQHPEEFHSKIEVIFDGIDTGRACPKKDSSILLRRDNITVTGDDEIITFVARNLEPYRGFHIFMRALPEMLERRPEARVIIVGADETSYGRKPPPGRTYKSLFLDEVRGRLDMDRVHFVGRVPYQALLDVFRVSSVHVYLTYPFVLSWSMLEAMSVGSLMVCSDTPPVREVVSHGENGLLVDFFDVHGLAGTVVEALENRKSYGRIRKAARKTIVENYDLKTKCLPRQVELVKSML